MSEPSREVPTGSTAEKGDKTEGSPARVDALDRRSLLESGAHDALVELAGPIKLPDIKDYIRSSKAINMDPSTKKWVQPDVIQARDEAYAAVLTFLGSSRSADLHHLTPSEITAALKTRIGTENAPLSLDQGLTTAARAELKGLVDFLGSDDFDRIEIEAQKARADDLQTEKGREPKVVEEPSTRERFYTEDQLRMISDITQGTGIVHTDLPQGHGVLKGRYSSKHGLQTFGDGSDGSHTGRPQHFLREPGPYNVVTLTPGEYDYPTDMVEAVAFMPVTTDIFQEKTITEKKGYFSKAKKYVVKEKVGEQPKFIENKLTGKQEEAVYFDYKFGGKGVPYTESMGNRSGNHLELRVALPKSVAEKLQKDIEQNPQIAREVAERLVLDRGDIDEKQWLEGVDIQLSDRKVKSNRSRPPYESMDASHRLYILTPSDNASTPVVARKLDVPFAKK